MNIAFDTSSTTRAEVRAIMALLSNLFVEDNQPVLPFPPPNSPVPTPIPTPIPVELPPAAVTPQTAEAAPAESQATTEAAAEQPARRGRKPKPQPQADAQTEAAPVQETEQTQAQPAAESAPAAASKPLTAEDLRALLNGFIARHSMEAAIEVLKSFGCNRVSQALTMEPAKLAELAAKLNG